METFVLAALPKYWTPNNSSTTPQPVDFKIPLPTLKLYFTNYINWKIQAYQLAYFSTVGFRKAGGPKVNYYSPTIKEKETCISGKNMSFKLLHVEPILFFVNSIYSYQLNCDWNNL